MAVQTVFQRYELKYIMTQAQQRRLLQTMEGYMAPDQYGDTTIRDLHFDTPTYRLIRQSIDKPVYKEKSSGPLLQPGRAGYHGVRGTEKEVSVGGLQAPDRPAGAAGPGPPW